jgi:ADP-ribose pyrophosphatase YjhB (NUDIX family)
MDTPSQFLHCPYDGTPLIAAVGGPPTRPKGVGNWCPVCQFVDYRNPSPCVAFFVHEEGRVLFVRRAREPERGKLDIPGGFIDYDETAEMAVVREAEEETDLEVAAGPYLGSLHDFYGGRRQPTLNLVFLATRLSGVPRAKDDAAEVLWFDLDAIPADELAFPHQHHAVELLRHYLRRTTEDRSPGWIG